MRIHIASIFMLLVGTAAGCGEVEDSSCPGEQSDNVACTLDVCNAEGGGWAHIPNNNGGTDNITVVLAQTFVDPLWVPAQPYAQHSQRY